MNKKITKALTVTSAVAMSVMGGPMVHAASPSGDNKTEIKGKISVKNVDAADEPVVTAYRIVEPVYANQGVTGFKPVDGVTLANILGPTSNEVQTIVSQIIAGTVTLESVQLTADAAGVYTTEEAHPGMYLVLVTGSNTTLYNPALVSLNLKDTNAGGTISDEEAEVDMATEFAFGSVAYLKKSLPTLDKNIVGSSVNNKGDTVAVGDEIKFEIVTEIPSYKISDDTTNGTIYTDPKFIIKDKLDEKFEEITNISVVAVVGGNALKEGTDYVLTKDGDNKGFEISFTKKYLSTSSPQKVKVTYNTKLTEAAASKDLVANKNTATLKYSNDPSVDESLKEIKKHTYHYSFNFDLKKIDDEQKPLAGAEFGIFTDAAATGEPIQKATSADTTGVFTFKGLDEGTYYVKELKAPAGFSINDNVYKVVIDATLNDAGILKNYTIKISGDDMEEVTSEFTHQNAAAGEDGVIVGAPTGEYSEVSIKNTKVAKMPSTGGAGTLLLSGAGITLFLGAAGAFNKARKMKKDEE